MTYLLAIFTIGLLILLHEAGHLVAAKLTDLPVSRFSIGFGPKILSWKRHETDYCLSLIPLGGYVMPEVEEMEGYLRIDLWRRWVFSLGGPAANLLAAAALLSVLNLAGGHRSLYGVVILPWVQIYYLIGQITVGLAGVVSHPDQVSSIVGIVTAGKQSLGTGWITAIQFIIMLSANLAIFNLLPLPPLDGGKIALDTLERLQPKLARAYIPAVAFGWLLLIALMVFATFHDISRLV